MQERRNCIANALEFCLSCTNPPIWGDYLHTFVTKSLWFEIPMVLSWKFIYNIKDQCPLWNLQWDKTAVFQASIIPSRQEKSPVQTWAHRRYEENCFSMVKTMHRLVQSSMYWAMWNRFFCWLFSSKNKSLINSLWPNEDILVNLG